MLVLGFIILGICLVFGSTFILLRTAKKPKIPKNFTAKPDNEEDDNDW